MDKEYYAHSKEGTPPSDWQPLEEHLKNVAELARKFADDFGSVVIIHALGIKQERR